jgi:hypothetical protein
MAATRASARPSRNLPDLEQPWRAGNRMANKEATARIKVNKLLDQRAGVSSGGKRASNKCPISVTIKSYDLDVCRWQP